MKFKKAISFALLTAIISSSVFSCSAFADNISVYLNEKQISFSNTQPSIIEGRTLVPLRGVFDAMGYTVEWDGEEKCAYLTKGSTVVETTEKEMLLQEPNGTTEIKCDVLPRIVNGSFMIPLRAVSEATGASVEWNGEEKAVYITADLSGTGSKNSLKGTMSVDEEEYLTTLSETTDFIYKFAVDKGDMALSTILFEGEPVDQGLILTTPYGYYDPVSEKLEVLKSLEAPAAMSEVQDCVLSYIDVLKRSMGKVQSGSYSAEEIENDRKELRQISQDFGVKLYNYFKDNKVSFEQIYGAEILDALRRN